MKISLNKSDVFSRPDLIITISRSCWYRNYVLLLHSVAVIAVCSVDNFPAVLAFPALLLVSINAWFMYRETRRTGSLIWHGNNTIRILTISPRGSHEVLGHVSVASMQCYFFVLFEIQQCDKPNQRCLIPRDAVPERDYRRLRSRLYLSARTHQARAFKSGNRVNSAKGDHQH